MIQTVALETSCDDTSVGVVTYDDGFFANPVLTTYSQIQEHQLYGWVVPEVAYRLHEEQILKIVREIWYDQIKASNCITVTKEPWLPWSLIVWNTVASMLSLFFQKPLYQVNHIDGHIFSLLLDRAYHECPFPWLILTASGWHNEIYYIQQLTWSGWWDISMNDLQIDKIWYSLDDAAGESFDKVARMLWGSYPGGPWISKMAEQYMVQTSSLEHLPKPFFKRILLDGKWTNMPQKQIDQHIFNFSFSGMKSQVHQLLTRYPLDSLSQNDRMYICHEFQECVTDILIHKIIKTTHHYHAKTIGLVWWVSANDKLYDKLRQTIDSLWNSDTKPALLRPMKKVYSTDNAAMIGVVWLLNYLSVTKKS